MSDTPRTDAAVAFIWEQIKGEVSDDLASYAIESLGATAKELERELAIADAFYKLAIKERDYERLRNGA